NQTVYTPYTLAYDAENRNTGITSAGNGNMALTYDGEGRRVKKAWTPTGGATTSTYYVYNALGQLAAEYSTQAPDTGTSYPFTDMLGSVRAVSNSSGSLSECYDYLPFGRMLGSADNGRSGSGCYPNLSQPLSSRLPQKFTGKERDAETGLDFFGARYMSAAQGRFMSPDPLIASAKLEDPQTWNRYAYARNNPLRYTDPEGLYASPAYECTDDQKACLNDEQRRILENSKIKVGSETLSGRALWEAIGKVKNGESVQNAFVNVTDRLGSLTFANGSNALSRVTSISAFAPDRIFADVNSSLIGSIQGSSQFTGVSARMHGEYSSASL